MSELNPFDFIDAGFGELGPATAPAAAAVAELPPPQANAKPAATAEPATESAAGPATGPAAEPTAPKKASATTRSPRAGSAKSPLYFDIETVPDESRAELFGLDPLPQPATYLAENDSTPPSELLRGTIEDVKAAIAKATASGKKLPRVVVEATIKMERASQKPRKGVIDLFDSMVSAMDGEAAALAAAVAERCKLLSVTPEFCRIAAIGWAVGNGPPESMVVGTESADGQHTLTERHLLEKFWQMAAAAGGPVVGYNVAGFDLPVVFVRSILLGVDCSRKLEVKPWGTADVVDLMKARFPGGPSRRLKDLARLMGIAVPAGDVDGSQAHSLFAAGKLAEIGEYVRSDVSISRELHRRYLGFFC